MTAFWGHHLWATIVPDSDCEDHDITGVKVCHLSANLDCKDKLEMATAIPMHSEAALLSLAKSYPQFSCFQRKASCITTDL